jgi:hypothetical protein
MFWCIFWYGQSKEDNAEWTWWRFVDVEIEISLKEMQVGT